MKLINGDTIEEMKKIKEGSIDLILCDPPYGTTEIKWDKFINFKELWTEYERIIKPNGVICLFAHQPFTSLLVCSNSELFRHSLVWIKNTSSNFVQARYQPIKLTEDILIFSKGKFPYNSKNKCTYNPQMIKREKKIKPRENDKMTENLCELRPGRTGKTIERNKINLEYKLPSNIIKIPKQQHENQHPTQKPVKLLEYLIKTYSNEGETVLDNTMGSGSTGVACVNTGRHFIGIELDPTYFEIATKRIEEAQYENKISR